MSNPYTAPESNVEVASSGEIDTSSVFSIKGRFGRLSFIAWSFVFYALTILVFAVIEGISGGEFFPNQINPEDPFAFYKSSAGILFIAVSLLITAFIIIFAIRRLHDINASAWWSLLGFIPLVNLIFGIVLMVKKGNANINRFAPPRMTKTWEKVVGILGLVLLGLYMLIILIPITLFLLDSGLSKSVTNLL